MILQRRLDGKSVVIKSRNKQRSFKDDQEIQDWVANMKLLFHMSGGPPIVTDANAECRSRPHVALVLDIMEDTTVWCLISFTSIFIPDYYVIQIQMW